MWDSLGGFLCSLFIVGWLFAYAAIRIFRTVDDDGAVRKTANEGFAAWLERLFKK